MGPGNFRFDRFTLDSAERRLTRDGAPVELNARYLDALTLLVREAGKLVSKDRFLAEVWRGVPVTDEALTQCMKTLRRQLGDDAARPRFIETVPKHGYRFIAPIETIAAAPGRAASPWRQALALGLAGTGGGAVAGLAGGLIYGLAGASQPLEPGPGAVSVLMVIASLTIVVAALGAAGVAFGIAAAQAWRASWQWSFAGGAAGGLLVGAFGKLLGMDAFSLLFGRSPGDITGAPEGALLGAAVGLGAWIAARSATLRRGIAAAAAASGLAGLAIALLGGRLMGGSLDLLARHFPDSRLRLDQVGALFGEQGFGPVALAVSSLFEGLLFGGCIVGAMMLARRGLARMPEPASSSVGAAPAIV